MPFFWHAAGESVEFDIKTKLAFSDVMFFFLFGDVFFLSYNILSRVIDFERVCERENARLCHLVSADLINSPLSAKKPIKPQ